MYNASALHGLKRCLPEPTHIHISQTSTLLVQGEGHVIFESLKLDGALIIHAPKGSTVTVKGLVVSNKGWVKQCNGDGEAVEELYRIRGYDLDKREQCTFNCQKGSSSIEVAGTYTGTAEVTPTGPPVNLSSPTPLACLLLAAFAFSQLK
jgi:hypothetical protein